MRCPICTAETDRRYRPFCSRRCADIDLGRWFRGSYAMPADEPPEDAEEQITAATRPAPEH